MPHQALVLLLASWSYTATKYLSHIAVVLVLKVSSPTYRSLFSFTKHAIVLFLNIFLLSSTSPHVSSITSTLQLTLDGGACCSTTPLTILLALFTGFCQLGLLDCWHYSLLTLLMMSYSSTLRLTCYCCSLHSLVVEQGCSTRLVKIVSITSLRAMHACITIHVIYTQDLVMSDDQPSAHA